MSTSLAERIDTAWRDDVLPALTEYITVPNVSKTFDADWEANGHMDEAVELIRDWCAARPIAGLTVDVQRLPGLTPLIVCEVAPTDPALADRTVLLYGHLDKQPEMTGWRDGLGPWTPVIEGDRLYGRGGADDGYAAFAALTAVEAAQAEGVAHARLLVLIEASEESGSPDLPAHVEALAERIGSPELVVCLDSGCLDDERLWVTTSLRGMVKVDLTVEVLDAGAHSGQASGVVPSSFRIIRQLLDRIEDSATGRVLSPSCTSRSPTIACARSTDDRRGDPVPPGARVPVRRIHAADDRRPRRAVPRRVVAADAELRRRRRVPALRPRRQRAAPVDDAHAELPSAPDVRPRRRAGGDRADADGRPAERRDRARRRRLGAGLERTRLRRRG